MQWKKFISFKGHVLFAVVIFFQISLLFPSNLWGLEKASIKYLAQLDKGIRERFEQSSVFVLKGKKAFEQKDFDRAINYFWLANDAAPFNPEPLLNLINTYIVLDQKKLVFKTIEMATKANTDVDYIFNHFTFPKSLNTHHNKKIFIAPFKENKKGAVTFSFDDGASSVYQKALPLFDTYNYKVTIPINPSVSYDQERHPWWGSWEQWKDASQRGHEIANHTMSHGRLIGATEERLDFEINKSYDLIEENVGIPPSTFVFPGDEADISSMKKVMERHMAFRQRDFLSQVYENIFIPIYGGKNFSVETANKIINMAIDNEFWVIAECHGVITPEVLKTYKPVSEQFLKAHLSFIHENEKNIWVDTFKNIYAYLLKRSRSEIVIEQATPNSMQFFLKNLGELQGEDIPLTVVINPELDALKNVKAMIKSSNMPLEVSIENGKILLNAQFQMSSILVSWNGRNIDF